MTQWEDRSEQSQQMLLRYLAGHDPWKGTDREIWPIIITAVLFLAQVPVWATAIQWLARCFRSE